MKRLSFASLRVRLILLVLFAVIPALGLTLYSGLEQRRLAATHAKGEALRLARFVSSSQSQFMEGARHFLYTLAQLPQVRNCKSVPCCSLFADLLKQYPWYLNIGASDLDGNLFASAIPFIQPVNIADRTYFQGAIKTQTFSIGDYQIGRIVGKPVVNFGYPVFDKTGKIRGVVFVALDLAWLNRLAAQVQLPLGSTITVISPKGVILARYPQPDEWVGKTITEASIVKAILSQGEGMAEAIGLDGVSRLYAFTPFGSKGHAGSIYVSVGIPKSVAFSGVDIALRRNLISLGIIAALALLSAWVAGDLLVLRRLNPILSATKRIGAGDLGARTEIRYGKGELSQLAFAFDQMAGSLEQRESERKRTEEALQRSETKFRELTELLPQVVFEIDLSGNVTFGNREAFNSFGYTQDDFDKGLNVSQMLIPEDCDRVKRDIQRMLNGEKSRGPEYTAKRKDGSTFPILVYSSPIIHENKPEGLRGIIIDLTEAKRAEEALRESEARFRDLYDHAPLGYHEYDVEGRITNVNRTDLEMLGYTAEEMIGQFMWKFNVEEEIAREQILAKLAGALPPGRNLERTYRRKDGTTFPALIEDRLILDKKGQIKGIRCTIQDITERERAEEEKTALEEQLRQSQKMEAIGQLAGGIAHDFNNLLTVIKGYSQLSLLELNEGNPLRGNIEEIQKASGRAADLTRQLLAFSRRQVMEMKVVDLKTILQDLEKMLRRVIGEDIELIMELPDDLEKVKIDPGQMEQVIINLAVNAKDAMPNGGALIIGLANEELDERYARSHASVIPGRYVSLSVSDTGIGMNPEVRERLFEPFFTTKEKGKGTGLGLSTVYGIVKQSGGDIRVYSEPGQGTTFKIYLPRVDEPLEELRQKTRGEELPGGNETVLLVEDDEEVRKVALQILQKLGYRVFEASRGEEASLICEGYAGPIHLMLTDVVMPGMDGRELAERMMAIRKKMRVLYMSGYADNAITHHGALNEGVNFIQKPFTMEGLSRKVREVLDKGRGDQFP